MGTGDCFECAIDGQRDWHGVTITLMFKGSLFVYLMFRVALTCHSIYN